MLLAEVNAFVKKSIHLVIQKIKGLFCRQSYQTLRSIAVASFELQDILFSYLKSFMCDQNHNSTNSFVLCCDSTGQNHILFRPRIVLFMKDQNFRDLILCNLKTVSFYFISTYSSIVCGGQLFVVASAAF